MAKNFCRFKLSKQFLCGKRNVSALFPIRQIYVSTKQQSRSGLILLGQSARCWRGLNEASWFCQWTGSSSKKPLKHHPQCRNYSQKQDQDSQGHDSGHISAASVVERLHELEERMRVKGYNVLRWGLAAIVVLSATVYLFREEVRENVADEVAGVASRSLGNISINNSLMCLSYMVSFSNSKLVSVC